MAISHLVLPFYDNPKQINLSQDGDEVRFTKRGDGWLYSSKRADDESFIDSRQPPAPLETLWHHAMVFFGVVDPDDVSHPPA